jgi:hypothetical protein
MADFSSHEKQILFSVKHIKIPPVQTLQKKRYQDYPLLNFLAC